jgi:hypothetical protein
MIGDFSHCRSIFRFSLKKVYRANQQNPKFQPNGFHLLTGRVGGSLSDQWQILLGLTIFSHPIGGILSLMGMFRQPIGLEGASLECCNVQWAMYLRSQTAWIVRNYYQMRFDRRMHATLLKTYHGRGNGGRGAMTLRGRVAPKPLFEGAYRSGDPPMSLHELVASFKARYHPLQPTQEETSATLLRLRELLADAIRPEQVETPSSARKSLDGDSTNNR